MSAITGVVLRQREYWMGWPGAGYPVDKYEKEYPEEAVNMGDAIGVPVSFADTIYDEAGVTKFQEQLKANPPDGVLALPLSMGMWSLVDKITAVGIPTVIFAPIGVTFTGHVRDRSRQKGVYFISSLDFQPVKFGMKMIDVKSKLAESRILVLRGGDAEPADSVVNILATKVRTVGRQRFAEEYEKIGATEEVKGIAEEYTKGAQKIVEPSNQDIINAARAYMAAKKLLADYEADAITLDCLGLIGGRHIDTSPCMAFSRLNDEGVPAGCEADFDAILTMLLLKHLFGKPSFMQDPVPETVKNIFVGAHCTSPTKLDGYGKESEPFILRSHSESNIGVSPQVLWREGQEVTITKFQGPGKMIIGSGTVVGNVNTPPAGGCRTSVEIKVDDVPDVRDVKGFHQLIMYGNYAKELNAFCQLFGIEAIPI